MSAKFRSKRYKAGSAKYNESARPITASSSSVDESYHSDFEGLENKSDEEKSNMFFFGESIGDKLNLSAEFNIGGTVLEEDEDIVDETKSQKEYAPHSPLIDYDEEVFEIASPLQYSEKPASSAAKRAKTAESKGPEQSALPQRFEVTNNDSTAENTLAEFSSITFGNSTVATGNKKSKVKRRIVKNPKKRTGSPGLPTIKPKNNTNGTNNNNTNINSIFNNNAKLPGSAKSNARRSNNSNNNNSNHNNHNHNDGILSKEVSFKNQEALPPRPQSFPSKPSSQRPAKLKTTSFNEQDDADDEIESKAPPKSFHKFQKVPITSESSVVGRPPISPSHSHSHTQHQTHSSIQPGSTIFTKDTSTIVTTSELHKEYRKILKQLKEAKESNKILQERLDESNIQELLQSYEYKLRVKDEEISVLQSENTSLKAVNRNQQKSLMQYSNKQQNEYNILENQEKDIEVLYEEMRRVKQKMFVYKEKDLEKELIIEDMKKTMSNYRSKNFKLKKLTAKYESDLADYQKRLDEILLEKGIVLNDVSSVPTTPYVPVATLKDSDNNSIVSGRTSYHQQSLQQGSQLLDDNRTVQTSLINEKLEKSYLSQIKLLQYDLKSLKHQVHEKDEKHSQLTQELKKRELYITSQKDTLKGLKSSYHELLEQNEQLLHSVALIGRDQKKPKPKPLPLKELKPKKKEAKLVESDEMITSPLPPNNDDEKKENEENPFLNEILSSFPPLDQQSTLEAYRSLMNDDNEVGIVENKGDDEHVANVSYYGTETAFFVTEQTEENDEEG
jgi:hypothetical protein